jgi:hypothetical protein
MKPEEFVQSVKESSHRAVKFGREAAVAYYSKVTGASREDADAFYDGVKPLFSSANNIVLNMSPEDVVLLLMSGQAKYASGFSAVAEKRAQAERAMGCFGMFPTYAVLTDRIEGNRGSGRCSVILAEVRDRSILVSGDANRLRSPMRQDYVVDARDVMYSFEDAADCRAASAIMSLTMSDLSQSPDAVADILSDPLRQYGLCDVLVFGPIAATDAAAVVADSQATAGQVRECLDKAGRLLPVILSEKDSQVVTSKTEEDDVEQAPAVNPPSMFCSGSHVTMKPSSSGNSGTGTVVEASPDSLTVEWGGGKRVIYDMTEALMRLMPAPSYSESGLGTIAYSLPGMDEEAVSVLSSSGIDPVTVYAAVSHARPVSENELSWEGRMVSALLGLGIRASYVDGFVYAEDDPKAAFKRWRWAEARLPSGHRLIVDADSRKIVIRAGDAEDYVKLSPETSLVFE